MVQLNELFQLTMKGTIQNELAIENISLSQESRLPVFRDLNINLPASKVHLSCSILAIFITLAEEMV